MPELIAPDNSRPIFKQADDLKLNSKTKQKNKKYTEISIKQNKLDIITENRGTLRNATFMPFFLFINKPIGRPVLNGAPVQSKLNRN